MIVNYKKLNPNGFYLLKYLQDIAIRFIILYGGSSSGKSYSVAQTILIQTLQDGENTLVMRKVGASIQKTIYEDYKVAAKGLGIDHLFKFQQNTIKCLYNGAKIDFSGLDDPEKIKGISNYKRVHLEELSEFDEPDLKQIRKRLRGKVGQQIICTFNPVSETCWIKKKLFDTEKWHDVPMTVEIAGKALPEELTKVKSIRMNSTKSILNPRTRQIEEHAPDMVVIQSTYLNNFWVVGSPDGTYGYYDEQCIADFEKDRLNDPDYYNVYALGEWGVIRTGSEFFGSFHRGRHSGEHPYIPDLPIHISVDNNVLPYISVSYWQVDLSTGIKIWQFHETCAESPNNTVKKSSKLVGKYLKDIGYCDKVYLHGDASTKAANSIDDEKRSWMDLFIDTLQKEGFEIEDKVGNKNPSVAMTGEFINAIFDEIVPGIEIGIDESCTVSIEDYMSVQKDANGAILKTKVKNKTTMQTYEEHGHMCFTPDTPIVTSRGLLPISKVKIGDSVLTEKGWQSVYNSLCTIRNSQYFSLNLQGQRLNLTYDHPIFTHRGFVPAHNLKAGDIITRYSNGKIWQEKLSPTTTANFIVTLIANVKAIGNTIADGLELTENSSKHTCTDIYGISLMAKFLRAIVFIILMVITIITHLTISPLCLLTSMRNFIQNCMEMEHGAKFIRDWKKRERKHQSGMRPRMGKNGILKMQNVCGKINRCVNMFVKCAVEPLRAIANTFRNFAVITAKQNGDDVQELTMKSAFARCAGLNLLSIGILKQSAVLGNVLLCIGEISDVYDISTTSHTFFANGVLVHNSDTFRYVVTDLCHEEYTAFSNRRKRNLYGNKGAFSYFNPGTEHEYSNKIVYVMPNVNGHFLLIQAFKCGEKWHLVDVVYRQTSSMDEIKSSIKHHQANPYIVECSNAYFPMVRELRETLPDVRVAKEFPDVDKRIAATSDYIREYFLLSESKLEESEDYCRFLNSLLDYNIDSENKEANIALSGLAYYIIKYLS